MKLNNPNLKKINTHKLLIYLTYFAVSFSIITLSLAVSKTINIQKDKNFGYVNPAVPSRLLDINGKQITQFISDENRELMPLRKMPDNLINTLLIREDIGFFSHRGFSLIGIFRAAFNIVLGRYFSGGSTLTQQLAKLLYTNQARRSILRKLHEIWWAIQLEKKLSKYEILEKYLNKVYFGNGNYGIVAASKFFFGKSVNKINTAESVMMIIQLPNAKLYSPLYNPEFSKKIQRAVLNQVVSNGIVKAEIAEKEFNEYWQNYDWTRMADTSAISSKKDQAPYFSEYIRQKILKYLPDGANIYKDGYSIYSTLDLEAQKYADKVTNDMINKARTMHNLNRSSETIIINSEIVPVVDAISDLLGIKNLRINGRQYKKLRKRKFYEDNIDLIASFGAILGIDKIDKATKEYIIKNKLTPKLIAQPEGAMIAIDTTSGAIRAMVGGSGHTKDNEFNRATQAKVQPGSAFKALYFAAAIDLKKITAATMFSDSPVAFLNKNGEVYAPGNYGGKWRGNVLTRQALALSLNIPALRILDRLGFDSAISYSSKLLGITDPKEIEKTFPKVYPLALGVISVSPIQMARAFAILGNSGSEIEPYGIRYIEDRAGRIITNEEASILAKIKNKEHQTQIVSPQTAYIITDMMKSTIQYGTLANQRYTNLKNFKSDIAGKSGTTQNWADGWAIGYSPYITTAFWVGFDKKGYSLGISGTGTGLAGPSWGEFMAEYHKNLPKKVFVKPAGIISIPVQAETGLLPEEIADEKIINELFISGTQPVEKSKYYENKQEFKNTIEFNIYGIDEINNNDEINFDTPEFEYLDNNLESFNNNNNDLESINDNEENKNEDEIEMNIEEPLNEIENKNPQQDLVNNNNNREMLIENTKEIKDEVIVNETNIETQSTKELNSNNNENEKINNKDVNGEDIQLD
ncbi:penicillin-binding protein 1A [Borreliella burgdorferi]|uniref:penicillin-binding protein 1A n=1 Tax=Borreliella burgdorferi TaxID=139 RepID=UPI000D034BE9|nr:penicillin-binding protein 1A [Borreliella burgdorferi]MCD2413151.1 PBP1A family penicillin-binding protein [Borreliella burgdorferi]PRR16855.1 penicillin-binding protein [Borreliella burgdorferi]PRR20498.1 penicillin-binding protein [Borreliella burgdorferi]PRR23546.1 penicillin-binding protein [Borreliella burgdorferi]PRR55375.1 penicillin-binding protein [Borreliella burgdorferi]